MEKIKDDVIYRQMAIDALMDEFKRIPTMAIRAKHVIEQLPSAQLIAFDSPDNWDEKPKFYPEDWREIL